MLPINNGLNKYARRAIAKAFYLFIVELNPNHKMAEKPGHLLLT